MLLERIQILLDGAVDAEVDHVEPRALHHHGHQVLADVVDVALDRADHHLADARRPGLGEQRAQNRHAALHGIRGEQHFRHEQDAVAKVDADDGHAADQRLGQHVVRGPAALEQDPHALFDLFLEAVVEVVVHLLDQLVVIERAQVQIVVRRHPKLRRQQSQPRTSLASSSFPQGRRLLYSRPGLTQARHLARRKCEQRSGIRAAAARSGVREVVDDTVAVGRVPVVAHDLVEGVRAGRR